MADHNASVTSTICVVLDGPNVATRKDGTRAIPRLAAALAFFRSLPVAVRCVAFVPNFWLHVKAEGGARDNAAMETDDWAALQGLVDQELVVLTPSHAHDDFYVIDYAIKNDGFIVTNDMFRDHVSNARVFQGRTLTHKWVRAHCIDFTFVGNEFLPNSQKIEALRTHQPRPPSPASSSALPTATTATGVRSSSSPHPRRRSPVATTTTAATADRSYLPSSSLARAATKANGGYDGDASSDERDDDADSDRDNDMSVDQVRKRRVDLSELTSYRFPAHLLALLHGDDGQTLQRFQDHTGTYIVAPTVAAARPINNAVVLTIYGEDANRAEAVRILDSALPELQHQFEQQQFILQQQQQQLQLFGNGHNHPYPVQHATTFQQPPHHHHYHQHSAATATGYHHHHEQPRHTEDHMMDVE